MITAIQPHTSAVSKPLTHLRVRPHFGQNVGEDNVQLSADKPYPVKGHRVVSLPDGTPALDTNGIRYDDYIKTVMPDLPLTKAQQWGTWMIRRLYQGTTRNTVYKWFGNPCLYKKSSNLSCSEYTLLMLQTCGMRRGIVEGWKRISNEGPNPISHPRMALAMLPFIGKRVRASIPGANTPPKDAPIPLSWFKDPAVAAKLANL